jgi:hypothetical protein
MGACQSQDDPTMTSKTKAIDKELRQAHMEEQKIVKLLLLGNTFYFCTPFSLFHEVWNFIHAHNFMHLCIVKYQKLKN